MQRFSMQIWIVALVVIASSGIAFSKDISPLPNFKQLCVGEISTGLDWKNGNWKPVHFKPEKYLIRKITPPTFKEAQEDKTVRLAHMNCTLSPKKETENDDLKVFSSCISVQEIGREYIDYMACSELHKQNIKTKEWETSIQCPEEPLYFMLDGWFHKGHVHTDISKKPVDGYKDSLSISVGRCADISK